MENMEGCQIPNLPKISEGLATVENQPFLSILKRTLAKPWNYHVKRWAKQAYRVYMKHAGADKSTKNTLPAQVQGFASVPPEKLKAGDWVRVRSWEEIQPMLDPFKETRGCAFLAEMRKYCDTKQLVWKSMERFLDERDYKVKKVSGVILLEHVICDGTPTFGKCDRSCFLFWREEWLEKISQ